MNRSILDVDGTCKERESSRSGARLQSPLQAPSAPRRDVIGLEACLETVPAEQLEGKGWPERSALDMRPKWLC